MNRQIFINLPVRDLNRTKEFFTKLGFEYNPKFTDAKAACMILNPDAYVMLLSQPFFQGFTQKQICDTTTHTEALLCISCPSRESVDQMVNTALASGGTKAMKPQDHGFMYGWSFYDLDGHHWEVLWMDPNQSQPN
jgi:predicted lactoylglutathione lyase